MKTWRWKNQYIDLIDQKRELIYSTKTDADTSKTRSEIQQLRANYDDLICELGSGSGGHLVAHALENPSQLFIGFELRFKRAYRTIVKAEQLGIKNLRMIQGDANSIVSLFSQQELYGIYINFPDPWEKNRWRKHRLVSLDFMQKITPLLRTNGFFSHKTDHLEYFQSSLRIIESLADLSVEVATFDLHSLELSNNLVKSEFENLFISKGLPVNYLLAKKK
jgi:tRNA (guanine-N7-)-methyltransferase